MNGGALHVCFTLSKCVEINKEQGNFGERCLSAWNLNSDTYAGDTKADEYPGGQTDKC